MSKRAEERALEAYPYNRAITSNDVEYDGNFCNRLPYTEGYEQAEKDLGWISVKDRLPEEDGRYITCHAICGVATRVEVSLFMNGRWIASHEELDHWMPIPELKEEER